MNLINLNPAPDTVARPYRWQDDALCAQTDPESFFPEQGGTPQQAKETCLACEVRPECLEYALTHGEKYGVWGGLSERERRALRQRRGAA
jgi:WhiB family redox-sensing transcriptional regulator